MQFDHISVAIVVSQFNEEVTSKLLAGAVSRLQACGIKDEDIKVYEVPGAVEIPLLAKCLAKSAKYDAIICLGAVIQGETDHYDYVCQQVSYGCQKVMLECELPIVFGVLTTQTLAQALARSGGSEGNKGTDSADTALAMITLLQKI